MNSTFPAPVSVVTLPCEMDYLNRFEIKASYNKIRLNHEFIWSGNQESRQEGTSKRSTREATLVKFMSYKDADQYRWSKGSKNDAKVVIESLDLLGLRPGFPTELVDLAKTSEAGVLDPFINICALGSGFIQPASYQWFPTNANSSSRDPLYVKLESTELRLFLYLATQRDYKGLHAVEEVLLPLWQYFLAFPKE